MPPAFHPSIRALALLLAAAVALGQTGPARAEPIRWDASYTLAGDRGSEYVFDGFGFRFDVWEPLGVRFFTGYTRLGVEPNPGVLTGSTRLNLGRTWQSGFFWAPDNSAWPPDPPYDDAPVPGGRIDSGFQATLTIRDLASGENGVFTAHGTVSSEDSWLGEPAIPPTWLDQNRTLGRNSYHVVFDSEPMPDRAAGDAWVFARVEAAAVKTPEPATLVLAGVGLAGAGAAGAGAAACWRRRRRGAAASAAGV